MHPNAWKVAAALGVAAGVGFLLSETELVRETIWRLTLLGSCGGMVLGIRRNRPARQHPWWLMFTALAILATANLLTYPLWAAPWATPVADQLSLLAFPLIGIGAFALARTQVPGGDRESAIDGFIVMIAMAAVLAGTAYHPDQLAGEVSTSGWLLHAVVAPLMMSAVAAASFRLLFVGSARVPAAWLLVAAAFSGLLGNAMRAVLVSAGTYERGVWTDLFILLSYVLITLAIVHPSGARLTSPTTREHQRFTHARLLVLGAALLAAPATMLIRGGEADQILVVATLMLVLLVLWRLSRLAVERDRSRRQLHQRAARQGTLAVLGRRALDGTDLDALSDEAAGRCREHLDLVSCELTTARTVGVHGTVATLPLADDGRALVAEHPTGWNDEDLAFLRSVANLITVAIERHTTQELMRQAAVHDALTGLPNRKLILDRLTQALARRRRDDRDLYVMFIDLDGFKRVNDELGHQAGDQILIGVAGRLNEVVRETDTVGRLAGDEFVVICEHTTPDTATTVAHRITAALSEPFQIDGRGVRVGASLGLTSPDADIDDPEQVLAHADSAMYVAKAQPGSSVATFHRSQRATHLQRRSLERDLEGAVERGELTVVFQPLWDLQAAATVGAEALLRWDHPTSGLLDADRFVPVAAESDLILTLGTWTLEQAVGHLATRQDEIDDGMPWTLYVNLSVRELSDATLPERVEHLLDGAAIRPDRLGFDIPEDAVLDERVAATASSLHALGVRLALDDFGAATTSLAQLHVLPWHVIKLDGALIARAVGDHDARAVVRAVSSLAHHLGIQVLAEQVETAAQEAALPDLGCDLGQGVRFHAPAEAADLTLPRSDPSERTSAGPAPR